MAKKLIFEFIGAKIKQKREEKGLTINELSLKTGIRKIYLQKIEEGKASRFSTTKLFMIAEALETHASMLVIGWEEFEKQNSLPPHPFPHPPQAVPPSPAGRGNK